MSTRKIYFKEEPKSVISETFRTLRTNIEYSSVDGDLKSLVITSSGGGEGKSTIATNLAVSMANKNRKVLVIDCDLRKPTAHKFFGINNLAGLTDLLIHDGLEDYIHSTSFEFVDMIPAGTTPPNPSELLDSNRFKRVLATLSDRYDLIILDSPPVNYVTDAAVLAGFTDGVVLVCAAGITDHKAFGHALELLERVNARILGTIINKVPVHGNSYYRYYYGSYYGKYGEEFEDDRGFFKRLFSRKKAR